MEGMRIIWWLCLLTSVLLNVWFITNHGHHEMMTNNDNNDSRNRVVDFQEKEKKGWSRRAAEEAEAVAAIDCSGHGRAFADGLQDDDGIPVCECNNCYQGPHCQFFNFTPNCFADVDGGDPLFLEPFWMQNAESSAVVIPGWHRMSYRYPSHLHFISQQLQNHIRRLHDLVDNAVTRHKYIVFGTGSTQLVSAAIFALSLNNNLSSPAAVVSALPYYPMYRTQTDYFATTHFEFQGDALLKINGSRNNVIEIVTSPNNPDGQLRKAVSKGCNTMTVYDRAYYWPHYTAIEPPADNDLELFSLSKLTGHAGSRFGWALVRDKKVYESMLEYINLSEMGTSKETQLRALQLIKAVLQGNATQIFQFGYNTMRDRWEKLSSILSLSSRFSIQEIPPRYCHFFKQVRGSSPAYAWVKCERTEDSNCTEALRGAKIIGREGGIFGSVLYNRYVRLSLLKSQDEFELLVRRLADVVAEENGARATM